jgi:hypothetical protein
MRFVAFGTVAIVATSIASIAVQTPRDTEAGVSDPNIIVVENFFAAVDDGQVDGAMALLAGEFIFTQIDEREGSFAAVGKPAFRSIIEEVVALNNQTTLSELAVEGDIVTGVAAFSDDESAAAGVERYLQPFTITLNDDDLIVRAAFTYDQDDPQTAEFLEFQAAQEDDGGDEGDPPGSVTVALAAQPGGNQPGEAFVFEDDGISVVGVFIEPGPEGVLQPAHFHTGTCAAPGPIVQPLAFVLDGVSFTLLSVPQAELVDQGLIINVHKSEAEPAVYVSCGEVLSAPAPAPTAPAPTAAPPPPAPTAATGVTAPDTGTGPEGGTGSNAAWFIVVGLIALASAATTGAGLLARRRSQP